MNALITFSSNGEFAIHRYIVLQRRDRAAAEAEQLGNHSATSSMGGIGSSVIDNNRPLLGSALEDPLTGHHDELTLAQRAEAEEREAAALGSVVHYALPPRCGVSPCTKLVITVVLVIIMAAGSITAVVQSIMQSSSAGWVCSNVSGY